MKKLLAIGGIVLLAACSAEPGSVEWCADMDEKPKGDWSVSEATTYAKNCLFDSMTIGSEAWCKNMDEKPKGEWTGDEAASYARHCVM